MEKERLAEHLERYHSGASNAATSRELELTFGIKGIQVRHMVNALRRDGVPIASNGSGYFYAATDQEVRATIAHLTHRIGEITHLTHIVGDAFQPCGRQCQTDQRNRGRHPGTGSDSGARGYRTDPPAAGWG